MLMEIDLYVYTHENIHHRYKCIHKKKFYPSLNVFCEKNNKKQVSNDDEMSSWVEKVINLKKEIM